MRCEIKVMTLRFLIENREPMILIGVTLLLKLVRTLLNNLLRGF